MVTIENRCRFPVFLLSEKNETRIEPGSSLSLALPEGDARFSVSHKKSSYDRLHTFHIFADVNVSLSSAADAETVTVTEFNKYNGAYNEVHAFRLTGCVGKCDCVYFVPDAALLKKRYAKKQRAKIVSDVISELFIAVVSAAGFWFVLKYFFPALKTVVFLGLVALWLVVSLCIGFLLKRLFKKTFRKLKNAEREDETDFYNCFDPAYLHAIVNREVVS